MQIKQQRNTYLHTNKDTMYEQTHHMYIQKKKQTHKCLKTYIQKKSDKKSKINKKKRDKI